MATVFVYHRSSHHAQYSGYSQLINYVEGARVVRGLPKIPYMLAKRIAKLHDQGAGLYDTSSVFKQLELYKVLKGAGSPSVVHYLNAERDVRYLPMLKRWFPKTVFCATFHKPPEILETRISNWRYLQHLDGAVAVGDNQVAYLKDRLPNTKVVYIPHGVDTRFFVPDFRKRRASIVLFVGQHLRDFDVFNDCVASLEVQIPEMEIQAIVSPESARLIPMRNNLSLVHHASDAQLLERYQSASLLLLPMLNSTACNSLLEAMACGVPIVTTDIGGNATYMGPQKEGMLSPLHDSASFVKCVMNLYHEEQALFKRSHELRDRALVNFEWDEVASRIKEFHQILLET